MSKLLLINPINTGSSHLFFDTVLLSEIIKKRDFLFIAEKKHAEQVSASISKLNYQVYSAKSFIGRMIKCIFQYFLKASFRKREVLFLSFDNSIMPVLLIVLYPFLYRNSLFFILHNNLTTLTTNKSKTFLHRWMIKAYKAKVYVLTEKMEKIYKNRVLPSGNCILVPHPHYKDIIRIKTINHNLLDKDKSNIVLLGRQAKIIAKWISGQDLTFYDNIHFTMVYSGDLTDKLKRDNVTVIKRLQFDDYYSLLMLADFVLFASDRTVENRASGILMDCISLSCPIIAPNTGHFLEYKQFHIGYFYNGYNDLNPVFRVINDNGIGREKYEDKFCSALEYSNPDQLAAILT